MGAILAAALVVGFWALLWIGAAWAGPDSRDGRDWRNDRPAAGRPSRPFD
jgi:hypothetical protein